MNHTRRNLLLASAGAAVVAGAALTRQTLLPHDLREETTVHWHGLLIPGDRDGGPHQTIAPGATWRTLLPVRQPGASLFYHSHVHGRTAEQVYAGLAGMLLVHDPRENRGW